MDIFSQNYEERCSFVSEPAPIVKPGDPLPMPSAAPDSLGILDAEVPTMEVHVRFVECSFLFETPVPFSLETLGVGRKEAEMFLTEAALRYTAYDTGSSRLHVTSKGVILNDIRTTQDDGACISILSIDPTDSQNETRLTQIAGTSQSQWGKLWHSMDDNEDVQSGSIEPESSQETSGFVFDCVIQQRGENVVSGPMVIEITALGAELVWPYFQDLALINNVSDAFMRYAARPSCSPYPENRGPDEWTYVNCILKGSKLKIPLSAYMVTKTHIPLKFTTSTQGAAQEKRPK